MESEKKSSLIVVGYLPGFRAAAKGLCAVKQFPGTVIDYELLIRDTIKPLFEKEHPDIVEGYNYNLNLLNFTTQWFKHRNRDGEKTIMLIRQEVRFPHYMEGYLADEEDVDILSKNKALVLRTGVPEVLTFMSDEMWIQASVCYIDHDQPVHFMNMRNRDTGTGNIVVVSRKDAENFDSIYCNGG